MVYEGLKRGVLPFCQCTDKGMTTLYTWLHSVLFVMAAGANKWTVHFRNYIFHQATMLIFPKHSSWLSFLCTSLLLKNIQCVWKPVTYQNLMRNPASEYTWGIFKSFFHVIALPSVLLIPLPIMFSVCLVNWPQMLGFYKEKYIFSAAMCLASLESEVIIYLICSPNKLLTLIFVSQHVSSWFVIESQ